MTSYVFAGGLYRNEREMCDAIAESYLCADGANGREDMLGFLADQTDEQMADECLEQWFSENAPRNDGEEYEPPVFDRNDLTAAFTRLRREFDARFPVEEEA